MAISTVESWALPLLSEMCSGTEAGSYLRLIYCCITQLKAQGPVTRVNKKKRSNRLYRAAGQGRAGVVDFDGRELGAPASLPRPSTLNPPSSILHLPPSTLNPQSSTLNPQPATLNPQLSPLNTHPSTLNLQPSTLNPQTRARTSLGWRSRRSRAGRRRLFFFFITPA